jgi:hypothetical protein
MVVTRSVVWACACVMADKASTQADTNGKTNFFESEKLINLKHPE